MADPEHLERIQSGVEEWNKWRSHTPDIWPNLSRAIMSGTDLIGVDFHGVYLWLADLSEADLSGANVSRTNLSRANLSKANLSRANLNRAKLIGAKLHETKLTRAKLIRADLRGADLSGANLSMANLSGANLTGANLREADLSEAYLGEADLRGASLRGASLSEAKIAWTVFGDVDLSEVQGLDTINHHGPSTIGIDTIYKSKGNIPESFLQKCGVPDNFITYMGSLVGKAWDYYSCFISYSSKNEDFAKRLYADLQSNSVRCWYAPEDLKIGDKFRIEIDKSIRIHDKLLLILSEDSVKSRWVDKEVETAMEDEEKRQQTILFPVRLDDAILEEESGWAADIRRSRHIGDFRKWKTHDDYQAAFHRLLKDLRATT